MASAVLALEYVLRLLFFLNKDSEIIVSPLFNLDGLVNDGCAITKARQSLILNSSDEILQPA